ncbi:MAG: hypothetical protein RLZ66_2169 [Pseudomonadota bacterium]|jgi:uncharacterized protein (TIGR00251 family)
MLPPVTWLRAEKSGDVIVDIHVIPNAARTQAEGVHDGALRVRLHAPPVDGKANLALMAWLATSLGVAKNKVSLVRGQTSKRKQLRVSALAATTAAWERLQP